VWTGGQRIVHLTVAGSDAQTVTDLVAAIDAARHVEAPIVVAAYAPVTFAVRAQIDADPRYVAEDVRAAVAAALVAAFSFDARDLAQPVAASDARTSSLSEWRMLTTGC